MYVNNSSSNDSNIVMELVVLWTQTDPGTFTIAARIAEGAHGFTDFRFCLFCLFHSFTFSLREGLEAAQATFQPC